METFDPNDPLHARALAKVIAARRKEAEARRLSAGYNGETHDGGASAMLREIEMYEAGQRGRVPDCWLMEYQAAFNEIKRAAADPGYAQYLKLKERYGNG